MECSASLGMGLASGVGSSSVVASVVLVLGLLGLCSSVWLTCGACPSGIQVSSLYVFSVTCGSADREGEGSGEGVLFCRYFLVFTLADGEEVGWLVVEVVGAVMGTDRVGVRCESITARAAPPIPRPATSKTTAVMAVALGALTDFSLAGFTSALAGSFFARAPLMAEAPPATMPFFVRVTVANNPSFPSRDAPPVEGFAEELFWAREV